MHAALDPEASTGNEQAHATSCRLLGYAVMAGRGGRSA